MQVYVIYMGVWECIYLTVIRLLVEGAYCFDMEGLDGNDLGLACIYVFVCLGFRVVLVLVWFLRLVVLVLFVCLL